MDLVFGWRTATLFAAAALLLPLAVALSRQLRNRVAAKTLAALLIVMVGVFTPWMIGFAGFYDQWRWLTFLPVSNSLLAPALLYLHGYALTHGRWPERGWRHLVLGGVQFAYQAGCFLLPMTLKSWWAHRAYDAGDAAIAVLLAGSFGLYGRAARLLMRRYRAALAAERSDDALFAGRWLTISTGAFGALAVIWAGCLLWNAVSPLGYVGLMPLYAAIAAFAVFLGVSGWRFLAIPFPTFADLTEPAQVASPRDWTVIGEGWAATTQREGWYRQEALTLHGLARLLGTNASYLSRALNDGLGIGFSDFINGLRCDDVAQALRDGSDRSVLDLAFEAGFASKTSFNRCFRARFGIAPSAMRGRASSGKSRT